MAIPPSDAAMYRDHDGVQRLGARTYWFQRAPEVTCPAGHRLHVSTHSLVEFTTRCRYTDARDRSRTCGRCIYVVTEWATSNGSIFNLIVEVTEDEIRVMRRLAMAEKFTFLGLSPTGPHAAQTR